MKCKICSKEIKNKGSLKRHGKSCVIKNEIREDVINLYCNKFISINKLSKKYKVGKSMITEILGDKVRDHSESVSISKILYPFNHTDESKNKMRIKRIEYMKNNPEKTAWRKSNMSYPEKIFSNKLNKLKWNNKYLIVREKSIFPYFIDFAFVNEKVALEIDGSQHNLEERKKSDEEKDKLLKKKGWRIFRVNAKEVMYNTDNVINELSNFIGESKSYIRFGMLTNKEYNKIYKYYCKCGNEKTKGSKNCKLCNDKLQRKVKRPSYEKLIKLINKFGYVGTGKKYNVSDNTIRKWKKRYETKIN